MTEYRHTQRGTLTIAIVGVIAVLETVTVLTVVTPVSLAEGSHAGVVVAFAVALPVAAILVACGAIFRSMTVQIHDGILEWWFGSGFPRYSRRLADIDEIRIWPSRGFALGIHWTRDGWLYNVSGMKGVQVALRNGKQFILGTDEPQALEAALAAALSSKEETS